MSIVVPKIIKKYIVNICKYNLSCANFSQRIYFNFLKVADSKALRFFITKKTLNKGV